MDGGWPAESGDGGQETDDLAERVGFEPTVEVAPYNGFRDRRLRPLSHLSALGNGALESFFDVGAKGHLVPIVCLTPARAL